MASNQTDLSRFSDLLAVSANGTTASMDQLKKNLNDVFMLSNGIIVCLMQCGFACLEAGAVRSKNVTNIIMKNLMDIFVSALCFWLVGYSLAYGGGNALVGTQLWAAAGLSDDRLAHWFFQFVFAATAATIVSGAVAERCHYVAYLVYSALISGVIYPVVAHWVWAEEGWLWQLGYRDYAGSGAVHLLAGVISLVAAALLGPRVGRFPDRDAGPDPKWSASEPPIAGHSVPLVGLGGMLLITGFLAFNGGTLGRITEPGDGATVARVMINTVLGGTGGSLLALAAGRAGIAGAPAAFGFANTLNAAFAGMVSVCAAADTMTFWSSFVSGLGAAITYLLLHTLVIFCRVDDPLDTVGVHLGGGLWGLLSASFFAQDGLVYGITHEATMGLAFRMVGAAAIIVWCAVLSFVMFGTLRFLGVFRVSLEQELQGLDVALHAEPGYPPEGWCLKSAVSLLPLSFEKVAHHSSRKRKPSFHPKTEFHNMAFEDTENGRH